MYVAGNYFVEYFYAAKSMDVNVLFFLGFTVVITINLILAKIRKMIMIISSM